VLITYNKWATNQNIGKKALYWAFYDELKVTVGKYPPIWRCVGCHQVASAALALYEQKKELNAILQEFRLGRHWEEVKDSTPLRRVRTEELSLSLKGGSSAQFPTSIPSSYLPRSRKRTHSFV